MDNISDNAKGHLPDIIQPQVPANVIWDNPNAYHGHQSPTETVVLHGTAGPDVFVIDVAPELAGTGAFQNSGINGTTHQYLTFIDGFTAGQDQLVFIDVPPGGQSDGGGFGDLTSLFGDPEVRDWEYAASDFGATQPYSVIAIALDTAGPRHTVPVPTIDATFSANHTFTYLDGHQYTLPQDPWLLT
ncbi:hypothetical protein J2R96_008391 [Bradyrhizobium elkanii]|nr:hypothetical protein [Bradyrhizobium elkanii]